MGPLSIMSEFPEWVNLLIGFIIGIGFGFALEQAGFSSSRKLAGMFYGYDTTVLKVFFTAAIVALVGS
ncbi:MAG: sulfurtransferase, partial [Bacteroidetes bacterium]